MDGLGINNLIKSQTVLLKLIPKAAAAAATYLPKRNTAILYLISNLN